MEISNLTLGRESRRVFQAKLLLSWVRGVRQNEKRKAKEKKTQRTKTTKKKITREKRKRKNQSIKDRRRAKENRKEKQVVWLRHGDV